MRKTAEKTKTATKGVMSAVKAVVGEDPDTFADVDDHPGSLDLPTRKQKINKLLAEMERLPKGSAARFQDFQKLLKVLNEEYAK